MNRTQSDTVYEVVRRCRDGDAEAMELLYMRYRTPLFNLVCRFCSSRFDAEDLFQEIWIKMLRNIRRIRDVRAFKTWMYRIAVNTCINAGQRQRRAGLFKTFDEGRHQCAAVETPIQEGIERAVRALPPKQRTVFLLHDVQGMTHDEVAQILKCTKGTSKSQLFKARMKIREQLKRE